MHSRVDALLGAERCDDQRHLVLDTDLEVVLQPRVGFVHDLVDGKGRGFALVRRVVLCERSLDLHDPLIELLLWSCVECGERADDACLALRDHQRRVGHDEERRSYDRQAQLGSDALGDGTPRHAIDGCGCTYARGEPVDEEPLPGGPCTAGTFMRKSLQFTKLEV